MSSMLFDRIVFGPIKSRRLGASLGINLLPADGKMCSFNCIYCECGWNRRSPSGSPLPGREEVRDALEQKLLSLQADGCPPDVITFAGNGEPTMHPDFGAIVGDTIELRNRIFPQTRIAVLSNATMLGRESVAEALRKVDDNILKLDAVTDADLHRINAPLPASFSFAALLEQLIRFEGKLIIQTMFLKGQHRGEDITNMTDAQVGRWLKAIEQIRPQKVMIYTIDRATPAKGLQKALPRELEQIAQKLRERGFEVTVSA